MQAYRRFLPSRAMRVFSTVFALTLLSAWAVTSQARAQTPASAQFIVGGVSVALPPLPGSGMVELGDDRSRYEVVTPDSNRLIAAYLRAQDIPTLHSSGTGGINPYALIEVLRTAESSDINASDFKDLVTSVSQQIGSVIDSAFKESADEFNKRMQAMNLNEQLSYGKPVMLGTFFFKTDAYGFGMIAPVTVNGQTVKMVVGSSLFRVRNRVLFAYFYEVYKDDQTPNEVRADTEKWTDAILAANQ